MKNKWIVYLLVVVNLLTVLWNIGAKNEMQFQSRRVNHFKKNYIAGDRYQKHDLLDRIGKEVDKGRFNNQNDMIIELLDYVIHEGVTEIEMNMNRVINDNYLLRVKACKISGVLGGYRGKELLSEVLIIDPEFKVVRTALVELANSNCDSNQKRVIDALIYLYVKRHYMIDNIAYEYVAAIRSAKRGTGYRRGEILKILVKISEDYTLRRSIRDVARAALIDN